MDNVKVKRFLSKAFNIFFNIIRRSLISHPITFLSDYLLPSLTSNFSFGHTVKLFFTQIVLSSLFAVH
ncbi:unknown [Salmonella phage FelixO1]|uniref:Uncharacterized protein n=1 Tax=Salmonella phage Felix O1 (isolate Felix O1-VT1) TaxID=1283336 RepID=Q6KG98_BPFO1|nr:unknown [Salmonella phage FelixO1]